MNRQQQRSEETRARILEAAAAAFAESGFDATSVSQICRAAGVTKGAFYHHYGSKKDVFLELLNRWLGGLDAQLESLRAEQASVPDSLLAMTAVVSDILGAAGGQLPIYLEFLNQAMRDEAVWRAAVEPYHRYVAVLAMIVRQGIDEGSLRDVEPDVAAHLITALVMGLLLEALLDPEGADWPAVARESIQMLLEGLSKR